MKAVYGLLAGLWLFATLTGTPAAAETPAERAKRYATDFDPSGGLALRPMRGNPDARMALRLLFARIPHLDEFWNLPEDDPSRFGPEHVSIGRHRLAPGETERLFVMVSKIGFCAFRYCSAEVFVRRGGRWRYDFVVGGAGGSDGGWVSILTEPIVGRYFDSKLGGYAEPTIVEPYSNGRPVFIWQFNGLVWDGREWAPFCWLGDCS
jgi:hypothetical protein